MYILPSNNLIDLQEYHFTILAVTLDKTQFIEALTPTYDVTYI